MDNLDSILILGRDIREYYTNYYITISDGIRRGGIVHLEFPMIMGVKTKLSKL